MKPVTLECPYCSKTIMEGENWGYGYDDESDPCHDECYEADETRKRAEHAAYIKTLKDKREAGADLSMWEMLTLHAEASRQDLLDKICSDTLFPFSGKAGEEPSATN